MSLSQYPWATFRKTKSGVRLHLRVVVTKDLTMPDKGVILPATHADRTQMNELVDIDSDAIHLFDRGYNDYKQFDKLCFKDVRFITRIKKNAKSKFYLNKFRTRKITFFLIRKCIWVMSKMGQKWKTRCAC
jgi:hypothetical protein